MYIYQNCWKLKIIRFSRELCLVIWIVQVYIDFCFDHWKQIIISKFVWKNIANEHSTLVIEQFEIKKY